MESALLKMNAHCLKVLNRKDEHMRVMMALMAKKVEINKSRYRAPIALPRSRYDGSNFVQTVTSDEIAAEASDLMTEAIEYSKQLTYDFSAPMDRFFSEILVDKHIELFADHDGFKLGIELQQLVANKLPIDEIRARLVNAEDGQSREIWLESGDAIEFSEAKARVWLQSNVSLANRF